MSDHLIVLPLPSEGDDDEELVSGETTASSSSSSSSASSSSSSSSCEEEDAERRRRARMSEWLVRLTDALPSSLERRERESHLCCHSGGEAEDSGETNAAKGRALAEECSSSVAPTPSRRPDTYNQAQSRIHNEKEGAQRIDQSKVAARSAATCRSSREDTVERAAELDEGQEEDPKKKGEERSESELRNGCRRCQCEMARELVLWHGADIYTPTLVLVGGDRRMWPLLHSLIYQSKVHLVKACLGVVDHNDNDNGSQQEEDEGENVQPLHNDREGEGEALEHSAGSPTESRGSAVPIRGDSGSGDELEQNTPHSPPRGGHPDTVTWCGGQCVYHIWEEGRGNNHVKLTLAALQQQRPSYWHSGPGCRCLLLPPPSPSPFSDCSSSRDNNGSVSFTHRFIDFTVPNDDLGRESPIHAVCGKHLSNVATAQMLRAIVHHVETHPLDTVDWGQEATLGRTLISLSARSQKLTLVWEIVKDQPFFADALSPISLANMVVWRWEWDALVASGEEIHFSITGAEVVEMDRATAQLCQLTWWASTPLRAAIRRCVTDGADVLAAHPLESYRVLHHFFEVSQLEAVRLCLRTPHPIDFSITNREGRPLVHFALREGQPALSVTLLELLLDRLEGTVGALSPYNGDDDEMDDHRHRTDRRASPAENTCPTLVSSERPRTGLDKGNSEGNSEKVSAAAAAGGVGGGFSRVQDVGVDQWWARVDGMGLNFISAAAKARLLVVVFRLLLRRQVAPFYTYYRFHYQDLQLHRLSPRRLSVETERALGVTQHHHHHHQQQQQQLEEMEEREEVIFYSEEGGGATPCWYDTSLYPYRDHRAYVEEEEGVEGDTLPIVSSSRHGREPMHALMNRAAEATTPSPNPKRSFKKPKTTAPGFTISGGDAEKRRLTVTVRVDRTEWECLSEAECRCLDPVKGFTNW